MKRAVVLGTVAAVLLSVGLGAQGRNFSGTWVVDAEKTSAASGGGGGVRVAAAGSGTATESRRVVAGGGGAGGAVVARGGAAGVAPGLTITADANMFSIANGTSTTVYKLDGSVINIENARAKSTAKATWQGDKIVIDTTIEAPSGPVVQHASWYLEGDSLVRENRSTGADGEEVVRKTYYKRS